MSIEVGIFRVEKLNFRKFSTILHSKLSILNSFSIFATL